MDTDPFKLELLALQTLVSQDAALQQGNSEALDTDQTEAKGAGAGTFLLNPRSDVRYQGLMSDPSEGLFPFGRRRT
jgi:hypothetical protein